MIRVILADAEYARRTALSDRLRALGAVASVEEASSSDELAAAAPEEADLVLVDAGLPGFDREEGVRSLSRSTFVVLMVEGEEEVGGAWEAGAFDVLRRTAERLEEIVQRGRNALKALESRGTPAPPEAPLTVPNTILGAGGYVTKFLARSGPRLYFVDAAEVLWMRAASNYVELHTATARHLVRVTVAMLEPRLDPSRFRRIHRSTVVNLDAVAEVRSDGHGQYVVALRNGQTLQLTRTFRGNLLSGRLD